MLFCVSGETVDMDISPTNSTPTSETSNSLTGTPVSHALSHATNTSATPVVAPSELATCTNIPNTLPRLSSHQNILSGGISTTGVGNSTGSSIISCQSAPYTTLTGYYIRTFTLLIRETLFLLHFL